MTERMTPSEIAAIEGRLMSMSIRFNMGYREEIFVNPDGLDAIEAIRKQAATIRELEVKLMFATEALEEVRDGASEVALITIADQALTRIEEVG